MKLLLTTTTTLLLTTLISAAPNASPDDWDKGWGHSILCDGKLTKSISPWCWGSEDSSKKRDALPSEPAQKRECSEAACLDPKGCIGDGRDVEVGKRGVEGVEDAGA